MHHSCGNGSCCSPSKLWRQLQTIVRTGNEQDFVRLCGEGRAPHVARVLLSQRLVNDPAMYPASNKHRVLQLNLPSQQQQLKANRLFGTSVRDLNALQMALFLRHEAMAQSILEFVKASSSPKELSQFVNHTWGQKNSSLHLAAYWGMVSLVRLLLDCGAETTVRNARQRGPLDGCTNLACIQLLQPSQSSTITTTTTTNTHSVDLTPINNKRQQSTATAALPRTSMLLKKAVQHVAELPMDALLTDDTQQPRLRNTPMAIDNSTVNNNSKPPLVFSSSTSSSSFSSLSSLEEPSSPGMSSMLLLSSKAAHRQPPTPTDLVFLEDDFHGNQQKQRSWIPPSPITPPLTPLSPMSPDYLDDDYSSNDGDRRIVSFSPNPMDQPTPICHRHLLHPPLPLRSPPPPMRSPSATPEDDHNDDDLEVDSKDTTFTAATGAPPSSSFSPTGIMINKKKKNSNLQSTSTQSKPTKSVRFRPDIVLLDTCVRGDVDDLLHQIKQHQQSSSKSSSVILKEWQDLHTISSQSSSSSSPPPPSLLHVALLHRQEKMVKCLISLGIDVNATDRDGWTPLHYASTLQLWSTVEALCHHPDILLHAKTNNGLKVYDCPRALVDQRRCRTLIERAMKRQQQQQQQPMTDLPHYCVV
ncbi:hypothetical protein [Absidia glauca]|uniref:ANK_REP_REGION domain-containing protein n=1 Tax=Absidia glauca TaxID=4829 RepID=A0A168PJ68_ABSGL|nr:hypothetical protein [Absidia glauca]